MDSASGIGGEVDNWNIDIVLGGSQKCLSATPGLSFMSISEKTWQKILKRKQPIAGFYVNLALWKNWYNEKLFPYTQPISDLYALDTAIDNVLAEGDSRYERHSKIAEAVRQSLVSAGLQLYPLEGYSNTVTSVIIPEETNFNDIFKIMLNEHGILIAGAFDILKDKVFRIGHMGENCEVDKVFITLRALNYTLLSLGIELKAKMHEEFSKLV
ncbi:pyridoxal-phosphate-dependent aminotransferase family protein [Clostridium oryzae]|uniref:Serine-pyruvate aminotransferase n=1 Tax=Clostridium oryzae TaxID=1450648 RepID=A0A1V4ITX0_9CLOT|nr:aminotransferase class V-fold PLP-dependent enzyme [Clostridium oryzae]OPJ62907.1 serine-pyruvate aminotransferase [Clostridium oryzae]